MKIRKNLACVAASLAVGLLAASASVHAVEGGSPITPIGVFDFGAGMLPPPSEVATFGVRGASYRATDVRDNSGNRSPVAAKVKVDSLGVAIVKMTDIPMFGGKYGYSAVVPVLDMKLDLAIPTPVGPLNLSGKNSAVGDVQIAPIIVQWTPSPGVFTNASLNLQLPTGSYDKARLINAGTNHWTVSPAYAFTYIMPSGFEVSSNIQLNFNGRNKATDYRSGIEYQQEFAAGQHFGPWTAGLGGYYYQQLTNDKALGLANGNKSRVAALGPAVSFFELGSGLPLVWVHLYKEFGARNRAQGKQFTVRAAWTF